MIFLLTHRQTNAVVELVDQDQVADKQGRDHRARRDLERLEQERAQQEDDQDHREQPGGPVQPPRLRQQLAAGLADIAIDLGDATAGQGSASRRVGAHQMGRRGLARRFELEALGQPVGEGEQRQRKQQQCEVAHPEAHEPAAQIDHQSAVQHTGQRTHQSSTLRIARKASCGTSTVPICFMRFLPAFCFSSSLRLREMSPP